MASWGCILLLPNAGVPCYLLLLLHFPLPIAVVHRYCLSPGAPMGARRGLSQALIPKNSGCVVGPCKLLPKEIQKCNPANSSTVDQVLLSEDGVQVQPSQLLCQ